MQSPLVWDFFLVYCDEFNYSDWLLVQQPKAFLHVPDWDNTCDKPSYPRGSQHCSSTERKFPAVWLLLALAWSAWRLGFQSPLAMHVFNLVRCNQYTLIEQSTHLDNLIKQSCMFVSVNSVNERLVCMFIKVRISIGNANPYVLNLNISIAIGFKLCVMVHHYDVHLSGNPLLPFN